MRIINIHQSHMNPYRSIHIAQLFSSKKKRLLIFQWLCRHRLAKTQNLVPPRVDSGDPVKAVTAIN